MSSHMISTPRLVGSIPGRVDQGQAQDHRIVQLRDGVKIRAPESGKTIQAFHDQRAGQQLHRGRAEKGQDRRERGAENVDEHHPETRRPFARAVRT